MAVLSLRVRRPDGGLLWVADVDEESLSRMSIGQLKGIISTEPWAVKLCEDDRCLLDNEAVPHPDTAQLLYVRSIPSLHQLFARVQEEAKVTYTTRNMYESPLECDTDADWNLPTLTSVTDYVVAFLDAKKLKTSPGEFLNVLEYKVGMMPFEEVASCDITGTSILSWMVGCVGRLHHPIHKHRLQSLVSTLWTRGSGQGLTHRQSSMALLRQCMRPKPESRNTRCPGIAGSMSMAHELVWKCPELLGEKFSHGDLLPHYILEPATYPNCMNKTPQEAEFLKAVLSQLTLKQLCHRNEEGICALSYAETLQGGDAWQQVRDWYKICIIQWAGTSSVEELAEAVGTLQAALQSACEYKPERLAVHHLTEVLSIVYQHWAAWTVPQEMTWCWGPPPVHMAETRCVY